MGRSALSAPARRHRAPPAGALVSRVDRQPGGPGVAVVGSRAASPYAVQVAERLAADLASRGAVVVSGLARGGDSAAHRGALEVAGLTIGVLGSGIDVIYPIEHRSLSEAVVRHGALVSELPPGTPPRALHFPARNRIISGLSYAVVVVEASARSGSLTTARLGLEQGREVMAVPGSVLTGRNRGAHGLLKDGAKVVEAVDDIVEELQGLTGRLQRDGRVGPPGSAPTAPLDGSPDPITVAMSPGEAQNLDELALASGVESPKVLRRLLQLELEGQVTRLAGGRFVWHPRKW